MELAFLTGHRSQSAFARTYRLVKSKKNGQYTQLVSIVKSVAAILKKKIGINYNIGYTSQNKRISHRLTYFELSQISWHPYAGPAA